MNDEAEVLFSQAGALGKILLNRPKALNALTLDMVMAMTRQLQIWADDTSIAAVLIEGAGEKGFCAGGDIRALYDSGKAGTDYWYQFYSNEYRLNTLIQEFPKPYIALMDGITMGGGVGVSVNGKYRIATDRTVFAMPETGIGLIPDVGGSYFLPRLPAAWGLYLGLTGARVKGDENVGIGIATHFVGSDMASDLISALEELPTGQGVEGALDALLEQHAREDAEVPANPLLPAFAAANSVSDVLAALDRDGSEDAAKTKAMILSKSPTSLRVTLEQLRRGADLSFRDGMKQELRCVMTIRDGHDFFEGVRAVIIDKDNAPTWIPATLEDVSDAVVLAHFDELGEQDLTFF